MPVVAPAVVARFGTVQAVVVPAVQRARPAVVALRLVDRIDTRLAETLAVPSDRATGVQADHRIGTALGAGIPVVVDIVAVEAAAEHTAAGLVAAAVVGIAVEVGRTLVEVAHTVAEAVQGPVLVVVAHRFDLVVWPCVLPLAEVI